MSVQIQLPSGCSGFNLQDGTEYKGRAGGHVTVSDEHAAAIRRQVGGDAGLVGHGAFRAFGGTREGRWCPRPGCNFLANSWSKTCPRCERNGVYTETIPESLMPEQPRSAWPSGCIPVRLNAQPAQDAPELTEAPAA